MRLIPAFALCGLLLVGCQTQTDRQSANSTTLLPSETPVRTQVRPATPGKGVAFDTDDCAARMHTLEGQLMLYYFKYQKLPAQLAELQAFADPGEDTPTTCPVSHLPYIYNRTGLLFGQDMKRLIAYDPSPAHSGTRWGVIFGLAKGNEPVNMQVVQVPEGMMASLRPAPELPSQASQTQQGQPVPETLDQLSPELRQKVLEQQRLLKQQIELQRQQQRDGLPLQPQPGPQQPVQQPNPQQPLPQQQQQ